MVMINYLFAFFGLLFASIFDLKTREIPDWLNFSMIAIGFGSAIISSFILKDPWFIYSSLMGFSLAFIIAIIFYKAGQWGGGDAKALMGLGALIGFDYRAGFPIFLILMLNILIVGAFYGALWSVALSIKNWSDFKEEFKKLIHIKRMIVIRSYVLITGIIR